ncbi:MAG: DNA (cytosine-5-)-methyltransferase [Christensenellaceae bacterium]|jgi:DNA (cytosine-5)-methyltransferase 1|nr:DNA (cytosine-5-)-methyltransferase [Christensenellaceae bacterium]
MLANEAENSSIKVVELFSGIGSQAKALSNIGVKFEIVGTCEWDIHAMCVYDAIHNGVEIHEAVRDLTKEKLIKLLEPYTMSLDCKRPITNGVKRYTVDVLKRIYSAILKTKNHVNIKELKGEKLPPNIDIMTYSFPCQDLSNMGVFHGYTDGIARYSNSRSSLLWQVERILLERKDQGISMPRFLVLENVQTLLAPKHKTDFEEWQSKLEELGFYNKIYILKAEVMGSAQRRHRLIMISIFVNGYQDRIDFLKSFFLNEKNNLENPSIYEKAVKHPLKEFLKIDYKNEKFLSEALACQPNDTPSRRNIWINNPKLLDENGTILSSVRTITTKQDRHPNAGNLYFDMNNGKSKFRYLTPRECFLLMGFDDRDYDAIVDNNVYVSKNKMFFCRDKLIHLAGNSISVPMLENVFKKICDIDKGLRELPSANVY